jgi:hypothetical protein
MMVAETEFMRTTGNIRLGYKSTTDKMRDLNSEPIMEFTENY